MKQGTRVIAIFLLLVTILYFSPVIFSHQTFASRDIYIFFNPRQFFAAETIRNGSIPLWNPQLASGVPFLANHQSAVFYPLSALYYVLPFQLGFKLFIILHYYLAGIFMFLLMRRWGYEHYSSLFSAIVFMYGGYMISILDNVAFLTSSIWLPLIIVLFDRFLKEQRFRYCVLTGITIGIHILGGDASCYILSTLIFMGAYLTYYVITHHDTVKGQKMKMMWCFLLAWMIGIALAAIQLLPLAELVSYSTRMEGFNYDKMMRWSFHPLELIQLLVPYFFGSTVPMGRWFGQLWLDTMYIGIAPLIMVIFSLSGGRDKFHYFLLLIIFFSLFLAFGKYNPLFRWLAYVPGINMLQYPVKFLFLAAFSLALLSGMGFKALFLKIESNKEVRGFSLCLLWLNVVFIVAFFMSVFLEEELFNIFKNIYPKTLFHKMIGVESAFLAVFEGYSYFVMLLVAISVLLILTMRGKISTKISKRILIGVVLVELIFLGKPQDNTLASSLYTTPNETVEVIKSDNSIFRIFSLAYIPFGDDFMNVPTIPFYTIFTMLQNYMVPNLSLYFHIDTIDEYAELLVKRYYLLFSPLKEFFRLGQKIEPWQMNYCKEILNLLNVKYIISPFELHDRDFKMIKSGKITIYENLTVLPRAYLVPKAVVLKDDEEVLRAIQEIHFNPSESFLITEGEYTKALSDLIEGEEKIAGESFRGGAKILKYSPHCVEIETDGNYSSFLVLADNYYPGWRVFVNGSEKHILRVNYTVRGVMIPRGANKIQFIFDPMSFRIGALVSFLTLLMIMVYFLRHTRLWAKKTWGLLNHRYWATE